MIHELVSQALAGSPSGSLQPLQPIASTADLDESKRKLLLELARKNLAQATGLNSRQQKYFLHLPLVLGGQPFHLLERGGKVAATDLSLGGWVAHQILISNTRSLPAGPAASLLDPAIWTSQLLQGWIDMPTRELSNDPVSPRVAESWTAQAGDAGWAGLPLEAFQAKRPFQLELPSEASLQLALQLLLESQSLIEPKLRWEVPLSCQSWLPEKFERLAWRVNLATDQENGRSSSDRYHLSLEGLLPPAANRFSQAARTGSWVELRPASSPTGQASTPASLGKTPAVLATESSSSYDLQPLESPTRQARVLPLATEMSATPQPSITPGVTSPRPSTRFRWLAIPAGVAAGGLLTLWWAWPRPAEFRTPVNEVRGVAIGSTSQQASSATSAPSPLDDNGFRQLFSAIADTTPQVKWPLEAKTQFETLLKLPANKELTSQLELGLALPKRFIDLTPIQGPADPDAVKRVQFSATGSSPAIEAELRLRHVSNGTERHSLLLWRWLSPPPSELSAEISLGVLQFATSDKKRELLSLPLSPPHRQPAGTLVAAIRDPIQLEPHLAELVFSPEAKQFLSWRTGLTQLPLLITASPGAERVTWLSPESSSNQTEFFIPDPPQLRRHLLAQIEPELRTESERAVSEVLDKNTPAGIAVRLAAPDASALARGERTIACVVVLQARNPEVLDIAFSNNPFTDDRAELSVFRQRFQQQAETWLIRNFKLSASGLTPAERQPPRSLSEQQLDQRARQLLASELLAGFGQALDSKLKFTIFRRTTVQSSRGPMTVDIPAVLVE
jgi:hypothetical protein